jgi:enediyne biosynthesis protein E4
MVAAVLGGGGLYRAWRYRQTPHLSGTGVPDAPASAAPAFDLREAAREVGLVHRHERLVPHPSIANIGPMLAGLAGAAASVVDYDGDGRPDVYLTSQNKGSRNALFRNKGDGTFEDVSDRAGLGDVNQKAGSLRALFFDWDNDGRRDLLLSTTFCPRVFHNKGDGTFEDVSEKSGIDHCGYAYASNAVDYDGDGFLDVIVGDYYAPVDFFAPSTTKFVYNRFYYADNGGPILVYHNERDGTFKRVPDNLGIKSRGFTHAVGIYDLRGTGRPDLYFATDFNADQLYLNEGGGRFSDGSSRFLGQKYSRFGMNAEIADLEGDGRPSVYVTDIDEPGHIPSKNALWKMTADGHLQNEAEARGVGKCGWSWGAKFLDLDNDGELDLVVSNGMVSQSKKDDYWYRIGVVEASGSSLGEDAKSWPTFGDASWAGYQKKCVFRRRGSKFEDVTAETGLRDDDADGRALAAIDLLGDGRLSLVEATVGSDARFYRNQQQGNGHWIGFDLTGTRSNRDAFGARVTIRLDGKTMIRELWPANGLQSQSDHRLHFGLGPSPAIRAVTVRWPSGAQQELGSPAIDRYHSITEPLDAR